MPARQVAQAQIANASSGEFFHIVTDLVKHSPDLAIDSLMQSYAHTRGTDLLQARNLRPFAIQKNTAQQFWRQRRIPQAIECDIVFLFDFVSRMCEPMCEIAIVCENDQSLALRVESAHIKEPRQFRRQEIEDGVARVGVAPSGDETFRLVQENVEKPIGWPNEFTIDLDVIALARLRTEIGARLTVDRDTTGRDQFVAMPPRSNAGGGEEAIETQEEVTRLQKLHRYKQKLSSTFVTL